MKMWYVEYEHKKTSIVKGYTVAAESDDLAEITGLETLENDDTLFEPDPRKWSAVSCSLVERCRGCGGMRVAMAPEGGGYLR